MTTPILELDEWASAQLQPEVVVNEAIRWLECFAALSVASKSVLDPPSGAEGDCYIVPTGATGDWATHANQVALVIGGGWSFRNAPDGAIAWVQDEGLSVRYLSGAWDEVVGGGGGDPPVGQVYSLHVSFDTAAHGPVNFFIPISGTFARWTVMGHGGPGEALIDIRASAAGTNTEIIDHPDFEVIDVGYPPQIEAGNYGAGEATFTDWVTTSVSAGMVLQFALVSFTTFTRVDFQLDITPDAL